MLPGYLLSVRRKRHLVADDVTNGGTVNSWRIHLRTGLVLVLSIAGSQNVEGQEVVRTTYTYKTVGDLRIRADVYRKPGDIPTPAILWVHGGALIMGNRRGLNAVQADKYLDAGYTIVSIDYRLAPQAKLIKYRGSCRSYRWVLIAGPKLFGLTPSHRRRRHSAGGYLTLMPDPIHPGDPQQWFLLRLWRHCRRVYSRPDLCSTGNQCVEGRGLHSVALE